MINEQKYEPQPKREIHEPSKPFFSTDQEKQKPSKSIVQIKQKPPSQPKPSPPKPAQPKPVAINLDKPDPPNSIEQAKPANPSILLHDDNSSPVDPPQTEVQSEPLNNITNITEEEPLGPEVENYTLHLLVEYLKCSESIDDPVCEVRLINHVNINVAYGIWMTKTGILTSNGYEWNEGIKVLIIII